MHWPHIKEMLCRFMVHSNRHSIYSKWCLQEAMVVLNKFNLKCLSKHPSLPSCPLWLCEFTFTSLASTCIFSLYPLLKIIHSKYVVYPVKAMLIWYICYNINKFIISLLNAQSMTYKFSVNFVHMAIWVSIFTKIKTKKTCPLALH